MRGARRATRRLRSQRRGGRRGGADASAARAAVAGGRRLVVPPVVVAARRRVRRHQSCWSLAKARSVGMPSPMQPRLFPAASCQSATSLWLLWRSAADAAATTRRRRRRDGPPKRAGGAQQHDLTRVARRHLDGGRTPSTTASARDRRRAGRLAAHAAERAADGSCSPSRRRLILTKTRLPTIEPVVSTITRCFCRSQPTAPALAVEPAAAARPASRRGRGTLVLVVVLAPPRRRRRRAATRARRSELTTRRPAWRSRCAGVSARSMCASARALVIGRAVAARVGGCWLIRSTSVAASEAGSASAARTRPVERARAPQARLPQAHRKRALRLRRRPARAAWHQRRVVARRRRLPRRGTSGESSSAGAASANETVRRRLARSGRGFEVRRPAAGAELSGQELLLRVHAAT